MNDEDLEDIQRIIEDEIRRKLPGSTEINQTSVNKPTQSPTVNYTDTAPGDTEINIENSNDMDITHTERSESTYNDIQELAELAKLVEEPENNRERIGEILSKAENLFTKSSEIATIINLLPLTL